ncbi:hypothetical protein AJ78_02690 [Emergomyces pasteurianus Ep9510]|uniref:F-box domain-containing protein n=1 Tax=Emergomyces pasteurianus Ep9510 TaxID=1447872 RepID=A0A1J9QPL2_9EURO|nr:hypothetical protein AJ78_02690 [Emergomyces pasteurianus Ep9510]
MVLQRNKVSLVHLPVELLYHIAKQIAFEYHLNALVQTNRRLYEVLNPYLYASHVRQHEARETFIGATIYGKVARLKHLLKARADPNFTDTCFGLPALSWAAIKGHEAIVSLLLSAKGIDPDPRNRLNRSPLSHAAENGHVGVMKLLLAAGVIDINSVDSADFYHRTPLLWAVAQPEAYQEKEKLYSKDLLPWSPWRMSIMGIKIYQDRQKRLYDERKRRKMGYYQCPKPEWIHKEKERQRYESRWAPGSPYEAIVTMLIEHGADLEPGERTPLSWAAQCGSRRLVGLLLDRGADIESSTCSRSPLSWAAENGHMDIVDLLLSRGARPGGQGGDYCSPLLFAARNGHTNVVLTLLNQPVAREKNPSLNTSTWLPLVEAAKRGHETIFRILLTYHKEKWADATLGDEAHFWAAYSGRELIFRQLIDAEWPIAKCSAERRSGITVLSGAVMGRNHAIVNLLLRQEGIGIDTQDEHGWTALTWAVRIRDHAMVDLLLKQGANPAFIKVPRLQNEDPPHTWDNLVGSTTSCYSDQYPVSFA